MPFVGSSVFLAAPQDSAECRCNTACSSVERRMAGVLPHFATPPPPPKVQFRNLGCKHMGCALAWTRGATWGVTLPSTNQTQDMYTPHHDSCAGSSPLTQHLQRRGCVCVIGEEPAQLSWCGVCMPWCRYVLGRVPPRCQNALGRRGKGCIKPPAAWCRQQERRVPLHSPSKVPGALTAAAPAARLCGCRLRGSSRWCG